MLPPTPHGQVALISIPPAGVLTKMWLELTHPEIRPDSTLGLRALAASSHGRPRHQGVIFGGAGPLAVECERKMRGETMRYRIICLSLALCLEPGLSWAKSSSAPAKSAPAPVRAAPAAGGRAPMMGGAVGGQHAFAPGAAHFGPGAAPARTFGGASAGAAGGARHFGAATATGSEERHFGGATSGARQFGSTTGERHFGAGEASDHHFGAAAAEGRRFGGTEHAALGEHGFRGADGRPRLSASGRSFLYHGHELRRFAAERYRWPHGYGYHRWAVGYRLPREYWIQDYYIDDYQAYGLDEAPGGFQWVRYGPDALLINSDTGQISQSVPNVFDEEGGGAASEPGA